MIKVGSIFRRQGRCPRTGERPKDCDTCPHTTHRGPETGEAKIFPTSTLFCIYEDGGP